MSVSTVKATLADLQVQIPGINAAYAHAPLSVATGNMPLFVNLTGEATYELLGEEEQSITRKYRMLLFVAPQISGVPGEAEEQCDPFFESVRQFFEKRPHLGTDDVLTSRPTGDGGVVVFSFGEQKYIGVEFGLEVQEIVPIVYDADNE